MELTVKFWGLSRKDVRLLERLAKDNHGNVLRIGNDITLIVRGKAKDILEVMTRISELEPYETKLQTLSS